MELGDGRQPGRADPQQQVNPPRHRRSCPGILLRNIRVSHQARDEDGLKTRRGFHMPKIGINADVAAVFPPMCPPHVRSPAACISRAGASSVAISLLFGRPAILIPYAAATVRFIQSANGPRAVDAGAAIMVPENMQTRQPARPIEMVLNPRRWRVCRMSRAALSVAQNQHAAEELGPDGGSLGKPEAKER